MVQQQCYDRAKVKLVDMNKVYACVNRFAKKIAQNKFIIYTQMNGRMGQIKKIKQICKK